MNWHEYYNYWYAETDDLVQVYAFHSGLVHVYIPRHTLIAFSYHENAYDAMDDLERAFA